MPLKKIVVLLLLLAWPALAGAETYEDVLQVAARYAEQQISRAQLERYCAQVIDDDLSDDKTRALAYALRSRAQTQAGNLDAARADAATALELGPDVPGVCQAMLELHLRDWSFEEAAAWAEKAEQLVTGAADSSPEERAYFAQMRLYCAELANSASVGAVLAAYAEDAKRADQEYFDKELNLRGPVILMRRNVLTNSSLVELAAGKGRLVRCEVITDTNAEVREVMNLKPGDEAIMRGKVRGYSSGILLVTDCRLITSR